MRAYEVISKKRDGQGLSPEEIDFFVSGFTKGEIPDYQMASLLMAIFLRGMNEEETFSLTLSMLRSGEKLDLSDIPGKKVDKHSTGGVGDKVSLVLAPAVAAAGAIVPMISGRGLGHTGGTLDKLESIPGFRTQLSIEEFKENLSRIGVSIIGQTPELVPADAKIYALRDVTATVDSIPLIASSIMSKKLVADLDALVLDVKLGRGAVFDQEEKAFQLARSLIRIGSRLGKRVVALVTDMDQPLGRMVGNSLEVKETIDLLQGGGPEDLREITIDLGAWMLLSVQEAKSIDEGRRRIEGVLGNGEALNKFKEMVEAQGGGLKAIDNPELLPWAKLRIEVKAQSRGYIGSLDAKKIGQAVVALGGGRKDLSSRIDHSVGIELIKKEGEKVEEGESLAFIYASEEDKGEEAQLLVQNAYQFSEEPPERSPLVHYLVTEGGVKSVSLQGAVSPQDLTGEA